MARQTLEGAFKKLLKYQPDGVWSYPCWTKPGVTARPMVRVNNRRYTAARVVLAYIGELELDDLDTLACHLCNNKLCFAPYHLYAGTKSSNAKDYERSLLGKV